MLSAVGLFSCTGAHHKDRGIFPRTRQIGKFPIPIRKRIMSFRDAEHRVKVDEAGDDRVREDGPTVGRQHR